MSRRGGQRIYGNEQFDQRLRAGLVLHLTGGDSGGTWRDRSGYGNHGTLTNGPTWTLGEGNKRNALRFDGVNDYVGLASSISLAGAPKTISFWVYWASLPSTVEVMLGGGTVETSDYYPAFDGTTIYISDAVAFTSLASHGMSARVWNHWAITGTGVTATAFRNGLAIGSGTDRGPVIFRIGQLNSAANSTTATLDDIRIYNRVLSAAEIAMLASPSFQPVVPSKRRHARRIAIFKSAWAIQSNQLIQPGMF